jgi:hypothetical protein
MPLETQDDEKASASRTELEHLDNSVPGKPNPKPSWQQLLAYTKTLVDTEIPHFMEFRLLQRLNIVDMQYDLAKRTADVSDVSKDKSPFSPEQESLRKVLREYGTSPRLRDPLTPC